MDSQKVYPCSVVTGPPLHSIGGVHTGRVTMCHFPIRVIPVGALWGAYTTTSPQLYEGGPPSPGCQL